MIVDGFPGDSTVDELDVGDRVVDIALDMSVSMRSHELEAKSAVAALCLAGQEVGDALVVLTYQGGGRTTVLTGPDETWTWSDLNECGPGGGTLTAMGVRETAALLERATAEESVLFMMTDGRPSKLTEAMSAVEDVRAVGHGLVGVGFGEIHRSNLEAMFDTKNYTLSALDGLADALVERYRAEMPATL